MIIIRTWKICGPVKHEPLHMFFLFFSSYLSLKFKRLSWYMFDGRVVKDTCVEYIILDKAYLKIFLKLCSTIQNVYKKTLN